MAVIDSDAHVLETKNLGLHAGIGARPAAPIVADAQRCEFPGENPGWSTGLTSARRVTSATIPRGKRAKWTISTPVSNTWMSSVSTCRFSTRRFSAAVTRRPEVELAVTRSYNRWLIDIWKAGAGALALGGGVAAFIHGQGDRGGSFCQGKRRLRNLHARIGRRQAHRAIAHFFPIYEEAGRLDLPICVHSATGSFAVHDFFLDECGFKKFKLGVVGSFHSLIFNEIPDKFPKTRWSFIEVSSQWVPYAIHDYARRYERSGTKVDKTEVLRKNKIWVTCQTDDDLPYVLKYSGDDMLIIGTDYGHNDTRRRFSRCVN